jgi:hypothetical protein
MKDEKPIYQREVCTNCIYLREKDSKYLGSEWGNLVCDNLESTIYAKNPDGINTYGCDKFKKL